MHRIRLHFAGAILVILALAVLVGVCTGRLDTNTFLSLICLVAVGLGLLL